MIYFILSCVQGIVPSLELVCPPVEHCTCVRHIYANFRSAGHKGLLLKDMLWKCASSYTQTEFHNAMGVIKSVSEPAYTYLSKITPSTWCRGWFNTMSKFDLVHNNCAECFNSWILKYLDLTILSMLEGLKNKLMRRYVRKRELIAAMDEGSLGPKILAKLEKEEMMPAIVGAHMLVLACLRWNVLADDLQLMWRVGHVAVGNGMSLVYHAVMPYLQSYTMVTIQ
jgi:hypothetical protein